MYILKKDDMQMVDQMAIEDWQIPSIVLMENAGRSLVDEIEKDYSNIEKMKITVVAGPGNNGGDGLVMARHLYQKGANVVVFVVGDTDHRSEDHKTNRTILNHLPIRVFDIKNESQMKMLKANLKHADLVIDAIFGVGLNRALTDFYRAIIDLINLESKCTYAVDCPSGLDCTDGRNHGALIHAAKTLTLAWPKLGLYVSPDTDKMGEVVRVDIGIPMEVVPNVSPKIRLLDDAYIKEHLPTRQANSHKNMYGHLGIIAGSLGMSGAAVLSSKVAGRSGAGLVTMLVDKHIYQVVATAVPEAMVRPVNWPNEKMIDWLMERSTALLIGPGMGLHEDKAEMLSYILANYKKTLVLDADALTLIQKMGLDVLKETDANVILTPHPGEMGRLIGESAADCQTKRFDVAVSFARDHHVIVVLKGHHTIVASKDGTAAINPIDSPSLATAGSGDVLAGMIAAFATQGKDSFDAAALAVALHGRVGANLEKTQGVFATVASDVVDGLSDELLKWT